MTRNRDKYRLRAQFQELCALGDLSKVKSLLLQLGVPFLHRVLAGSLTDACSSGHLEVAIFLWESWHPTRSNYSFQDGLRRAIQSNHLEVVAWIIQTCQQAKFSFQIQYSMIRHVIDSGRRKLAHLLWPLCQQASFPDAYRRHFPDLCCRKSAYRGSIRTSFSQAFRALTICDELGIELNLPNALCRAARTDYLEMTQWLWKELYSREEDEQVRFSNAKDGFLAACRANQLPSAQWLRTICDPSDLSAIEDEFFRTRVTGHVEMAQWLWECSPGIQIEEDDHRMLSTTCYNRFYDLAAFLVTCPLASPELKYVHYRDQFYIIYDYHTYPELRPTGKDARHLSPYTEFDGIFIRAIWNRQTREELEEVLRSIATRPKSARSAILPNS